MRVINIFLLIVILPVSIICMSEKEREELKFERGYLNWVQSELLTKQQCMIWTGGAGLCYGLIKSAQAKKGGALAGLSVVAMSGAGFTYLEHQLQNNNTERTKITKKLQQLTDK